MGHTHHDGTPHGYAHTHGAIDPSIASSERGLWAVKWSCVGLLITVLVQTGAVYLSGSVALLADVFHNVGDAITAIPLSLAFWMSRWQPSQRFTYGYGRVEDLAGILIVGIVLTSAIATGYESVERFLHPQQLEHLEAIAIAGFIGFIGNELIALLRLRVGKEIGSAALIADGYHARMDGLVSLAVLISAIGTYWGYDWVDPAIGLVITAVLLKIVWEAAQTVFTRLLDGVEPEVTATLQEAVEQIAGVRTVKRLRCRWLGHKLQAEVAIAVDPTLKVAAAEAIALAVKTDLAAQVPYLAEVGVQLMAAAPGSNGPVEARVAEAIAGSVSVEDV